MAVEWTGLSPELLVPLDRDPPRPLRSPLEPGLRDAIRAGRLRAGERLPSTRELAGAGRVSRGLVVDCFDQLQAEGYLVARAARDPGGLDRAGSPPVRPHPPRSRAAAGVDFLPGGAGPGQLPACGLGVGGPRGLPRARRPLRSATTTRPGTRVADGPRQLPAAGCAAQPPTPAGSSSARASRRVSTSRSPHWPRAGCERVGFEDPGYDETGPSLRPGRGSNRSRSRSTSRASASTLWPATGPGAVVLTPAHQWPTGVVLRPERGMHSSTGPSGHGGRVVEDDYDAEFRYDKEPVGAAAGSRPGPGDLDRHRQQVAGADASARMDAVPPDVVEPVAD